MGDPVKLIGEDPVTSGYTSSALVYSRKVAILSGKVRSVKVYANVGGAGKVAIYSDKDNAPFGLLGYSAENIINTGLNEIQLISDVEISEGTYYWIAAALSSTARLAGTNSGNMKTTLDTDGFVYSSEYEFPNPATYTRTYTWKFYAAGWGTLASGGAGRLIGGPGKHPLISGPGKHPLVSCGGNALIG